ncbi:MAG: hypothetical protein KC502_13100, partial [Myxococcales bacterium]|nr:hypothetical protein [Myxococcales bacterium]
CQPRQGWMFWPANGLCDDGNPCTQSACDAKKGCASGPGKAGVPCDDGNKCTAKDACNGLGKCASGINTCGCSNDGECQVGADGAPAGDKCKPLACIGGKCEVNPKAEVVCPDSKQPCLASVCQSQTGKCSLVPAKQGKACDDGNACTLKSACASGKCAALIEADCDDKNKCTADKCDAKAGANGQGACVHSAIPGCGGGCQSHSACDDNNPCTQDTCGADGKCSHVTLDDCPAKQCKSAKDCPQPGAPCMQATCSDAGVCSVAAVPGCGGTGCQTGAACNDNNPCTKDTCGDDGKCSFTPIVGCKACTSSGACTDLNPCTTDTCTKGFCTHSATPGCKQCKTDSHCDDGNKCTKTACTGKLANGIGKCQSKPILGGGCDQCTSDSHCKDTNPCTTDKCGTTGVFKGKCQYNKVNCFDGKPCTYDVCDPAKGGCSHAKIPNCGSGCKNSTQCADNSPCITSYCSGGVCKSSIKNCNDNNACTFDACDNNTGKCVFSPIAGCSVGKCSAKEDCNDGDPCTYDTCSNFSGKCYNSTIPNCDPTAPKCKSVADCDDKKPCTNDYCSSFTGKCSHTNINNCVTGKYCKSKSDCDDKKKCTSNPCVGNKCQTVPITCNDYNPCTNDYCQSYTGKCIYTNKPGCTVEKCTTTSQCDDQNKCTLDTCLFGFCQHNLKPGCS